MVGVEWREQTAAIRVPDEPAGAVEPRFLAMAEAIRTTKQAQDGGGRGGSQRLTAAP